MAHQWQTGSERKEVMAVHREGKAFAPQANYPSLQCFFFKYIYIRFGPVLGIKNL